MFLQASSSTEKRACRPHGVCSAARRTLKLLLIGSARPAANHPPGIACLGACPAPHQVPCAPATQDGPTDRPKKETQPPRQTASVLRAPRLLAAPGGSARSFLRYPGRSRERRHRPSPRKPIHRAPRAPPECRHGPYRRASSSLPARPAARGAALRSRRFPGPAGRERLGLLRGSPTADHSTPLRSSPVLTEPGEPLRAQRRSQRL